MNIIISGGTGLIGSHLTEVLLGRGHQVWVLTRNKSNKTVKQGVQLVEWDSKTSNNWGHLVNEMDAIVNLAGENIGSGRWTPKKKRKIVDSRLNAGRAVVEAVKKADKKPAVVLQSSGISYYKPNLETELTVDSPHGDDFIANTAIKWENSTLEVEEYGVRRVVMRTSQVLSPEGGSMTRILAQHLLFVGGPLGSGKQWWSWMHIQDAVDAMVYFLENDSISGTVNLCSPNPVRMDDFGRILAKVLHRPYWFPVPAFLIRFIFGEMSKVVLDGHKVIPEKLINSDFTYKYPELEPAFRDLFEDVSLLNVITNLVQGN